MKSYLKIVPLFGILILTSQFAQTTSANGEIADSPQLHKVGEGIRESQAIRIKNAADHSPFITNYYSRTLRVVSTPGISNTEDSPDYYQRTQIRIKNIALQAAMITAVGKEAALRGNSSNGPIKPNRAKVAKARLFVK